METYYILILENIKMQYFFIEKFLIYGNCFQKLKCFQFPKNHNAKTFIICVTLDSATSEKKWKIFLSLLIHLLFVIIN